MVRVRGFRGGALFLAIVGFGWLAALLASGHAGSADSTPPAADPASAPAFATVLVPAHSRLTTTARVNLPDRTAGTAEILVLLDSADIRACEDLGRQLRELRNRAGPSMPLVVVADLGAMTVVRTFARRERLRATGFVALGSRDVLTGEAHLPTPAVLVVRGREVLAGVGHPRRFPNVRVRSFADELSAYLPSTSGSAVTRDTGRLQ